MGKRSVWGALAAWVTTASACEPAVDAPGHAVRDSAGVSIVENRQPAWGGEEEWRLASEPVVRIGVVEGAPGYELSDVVGSVRSAHGAIVVADGGTQEVRFYEADGTLARRVGGPGGGPGEFTGLSGLGRAPDGSIWAYDFTLRRITWLDPAGELLRVTSLDPEPPVLSPVGAVGVGSFVLRQLWGARGAASATGFGLRRDPVAYVRYDVTGSLVDTLALVPGREIRLAEEGGRAVMSTPPFGRNSVGVIRGGNVVVGSQTSFELRELGVDGTLLRIVRLPDADLRLTDEDVRAFLRSRLDRVPPERRAQVERDLMAMDFPDLRPAHGELLVDAGDRIWVGDWAESPEAPRRWTVIDADGRWLGGVPMPPRFRPSDVGDTWVLGVERDELGVERVVMYELEKRS